MPLTPAPPVQIYSLDDPAIDADAMGKPGEDGKSPREQYITTLDEKHLVIFPNKKPVRFLATPMTHGWKRDHIESLPPDALTARGFMALRGAVFQITLADGTVLTTSTDTTKTGQRVAPEAWIEMVCETVGENVAIVMGLRALDLTMMKASDRPISPSLAG